MNTSDSTSINRQQQRSAARGAELLVATAALVLPGGLLLLPLLWLMKRGQMGAAKTVAVKP